MKLDTEPTNRLSLFQILSSAILLAVLIAVVVIASQSGALPDILVVG